MKNDKLVKILENLGLSDNEARVYLASLSLGSTTIMKIAQTAEIKRTTVYSVIDSLKQMGLMKIEVKGFKQLYLAESPDRLDSIISSHREALKGSLPEFMAIYNLKGGESFIKYYEGIEACKSIYEELLNKENLPYDFYYVISNQDMWHKQDPEYFSRFVERRARMGITAKVLYVDSPITQEYMRRQVELRQEAKLLPKSVNITTNMIITSKRVVSHNIVPPIVAIVIENQGVIQTNKEMFEIMWRSIS